MCTFVLWKLTETETESKKTPQNRTPGIYVFLKLYRGLVSVFKVKQSKHKQKRCISVVFGTTVAHVFSPDSRMNHEMLTLTHLPQTNLLPLRVPSTKPTVNHS